MTTIERITPSRFIVRAPGQPEAEIDTRALDSAECTAFISLLVDTAKRGAFSADNYRNTDDS